MSGSGPPGVLTLRPLVDADAAVLAGWGEDPALVAAAGWSPDLSLAERTARFRALVAAPPADLLRWGGVLDGRLVGYADLHGSSEHERELGYLVGVRSLWGRGIGGSLAALACDRGFDDLGLERVVAEVEPGNLASERILLRLGMRPVGDGRFALSRSERPARRGLPDR